MFCKKAVLKIFGKLTGEHLWWSVTSVWFAALLKCFPVNFPKISRAASSTEHLRTAAYESSKALLKDIGL